MATAYNPKIVTDGLVLCLDAADRKSYTGTGTTWTDRSGNGNNATLVNGPTFSNTNGGVIEFDGTDDYATLPCSELVGESTISIEMFTNWRENGGGMFLGFTTYDVYTHGGRLGYNNGNSNVIGIDASTVTSLGLIGSYHHYVFIMNSSGNMTTNKIYIDGEDQGTLTAVLNNDGPCRAFTNTMRINSWNNGGYSGDNDNASFKVYNRELTAAEILQNYNATKGRFGL